MSGYTIHIIGLVLAHWGFMLKPYTKILQINLNSMDSMIAVYKFTYPILFLILIACDIACDM